MATLKARATVSVIDPQYPSERQKILLNVASPRFLVCIQRANKEFGKPSDIVMDFISSNLSKHQVHCSSQSSAIVWS